MANIYDFLDERDQLSPQITFRQFIELYTVAPNKWFLHNYGVRYNGDKINFKKYRDYKKYRRWKKNKDNLDGKRKRYSNTSVMINYWQKDIETYKAKFEKEIADELKKLYKE